MNTYFILCNYFFKSSIVVLTMFLFHFAAITNLLENYRDLLYIFNNNKQQQKTHKNIHSTMSWDVSHVRYIGKLAHTYIFSVLFVSWETCDWTYRSQHETKVLFNNRDTFSVNNLVENWTVQDGRHSNTEVGLYMVSEPVTWQDLNTGHWVMDSWEMRESPPSHHVHPTTPKQTLHTEGPRG